MKEELWLRDTNLFKLAWEIQTSQDIYTTMCPSYNLKHYNQSDRCFQYNQESTGSPSSSRSKRPVYQSNFDHNTNGSTAVVINLFFHYTIHNRQGGEWLRRSAQNGGTTAVNQFYWGCNTSDRNLATRSNPCLVDLFSLSFPFFSFFFSPSIILSDVTMYYQSYNLIVRTPCQGHQSRHQHTRNSWRQLSERGSQEGQSDYARRRP
jgi:hypothetical protein